MLSLTAAASCRAVVACLGCGSARLRRQGPAWRRLRIWRTVSCSSTSQR